MGCTEAGTRVLPLARKPLNDFHLCNYACVTRKRTQNCKTNMNINYYKQSRMLLGAALIVAQAALVSTYAGDASENRGQLSAADYKFAKQAARRPPWSRRC